jgi:ABC-type glutathione transport system ATPase component
MGQHDRQPSADLSAKRPDATIDLNLRGRQQWRRESRAGGEIMRRPIDSPIVQAHRLRKVYHGAEEVEALRDIDLTIERGEMVAIVGPSGSGKTTLLNCLSGLGVIDGGQVVVEGTDLSSMSDGALSAYRSKAVGFVFQTRPACGSAPAPAPPAAQPAAAAERARVRGDRAAAAGAGVAAGEPLLITGG